MNDTLLNTIEYIEWVRAIAVFITAVCVMAAYYCRKKYMQCIAARDSIYHVNEQHILDIIDDHIVKQIENFERRLMKRSNERA